MRGYTLRPWQMNHAAGACHSGRATAGSRRAGAWSNPWGRRNCQHQGRAIQRADSLACLRLARGPREGLMEKPPLGVPQTRPQGKGRPNAGEAAPVAAPDPGGQKLSATGATGHPQLPTGEAGVVAPVRGPEARKGKATRTRCREPDRVPCEEATRGLGLVGRAWGAPGSVRYCA